MNDSLRQNSREYYSHLALHNGLRFPVGDLAASSSSSEPPPALFRKYSDSSSKYSDSSTDSESPPPLLSRKDEPDSSSSDDDGAPATSALGPVTRRHCKWHTVQRFSVSLDDSASDAEEVN